LLHDKDSLFLQGWADVGILPNFTNGRPLVIGYFARICPEKGFQNVIDAFIELRKSPGSPEYKLRASGWLGENNRPFFQEQSAKLKLAGLLVSAVKGRA